MAKRSKKKADADGRAKMSDDGKHLKRPVNLDELVATLRRYARAPRKVDPSRLSRAERMANDVFGGGTVVRFAPYLLNRKSKGI
jgi:hypothetical protein